MARTIEMSVSRDELAELLLSGDIVERTGQPHAANCSRCGRPYEEHPHSVTGLRYMLAHGEATESMHAFRTQNDLGIWLTGRRVDGLLFEPDGRWDHGRG
jgi:hypothetical protein